MTAFLLVRARARVVALAVDSVVEIMRPRPVEPVPGGPSFLRGLAVIRGAPVPVVDLGTVLASAEPPDARRFVTVRTGERRVALAVEAVLGTRELDAATVGDLPPLLADGPAGPIAAIGVVDRKLLVVLAAARIVPEALWPALAGAGGVA